jgi:hypothetical protein
VLLGDCETDETLFIPAGMTLDGRGHRVTVLDPAGGSFTGAVVQNSGPLAQLRALVIDAQGLAQVCHEATPDDQRLRGVLFIGASGSIVDNQIAINQGASGCQEGTAIEVRAGAEANPRGTPYVAIRSNVIEHFQKTGIFVEGPLNVSIQGNRVQGEGAISYIAQNGIQLTGAVRGTLELNQVSGTIFAGSAWSSTGILVVGAPGDLLISSNHVQEADVAIRLTGVSGAEVRNNLLEQSTYDGITLDGRSDDAARNRIVGNRALDCDVGIDLLGAGARFNLVTLNQISDSGSAAIQVALGASDNLVAHNWLGGGALVEEQAVAQPIAPKL